MANRLYVGNVSFNTREEALRDALSRVGRTDEVRIVLVRETGCSRGFAFVSMADAQGARDALAPLDGTVLDGLPLRVKTADERQSSGSRSDRGAHKW